MGESVSLSCHNTSSLGTGGSVEWDLGGEALSRGSSSLVIAKVGALHAGEYRCSDSADRQRVFNRISLQTLEGECENVGPNPELSPAPPTFYIFSHVCRCSQSRVRGRPPRLDLRAHLCQRVQGRLQFSLEGRRGRRLAERISER